MFAVTVSEQIGVPYLVPFPKLDSEINKFWTKLENEKVLDLTRLENER